MPRTYVTPYQGQGSSLPPGYLEAATAPGRNLADGIVDAGKSIANGIQQRTLMQREDAQQAREEAKQAEQEAKDLAKQRAANEGIIRAYKTSVDPRELALMGANEVESLARMVQLDHQINRDKQLMSQRERELQLKKLAGQMEQQKVQGTAAYLQAQKTPELIRRPDYLAQILKDNPAAAGEIAKMMPDPNALRIGQMVKFPDGRRGYATSKGAVQLEEQAKPEKPPEELILKQQGGKTFVQRDGKWFPLTDPSDMLMILDRIGGGRMGMPAAGAAGGKANDPLGIR